MINLPTNKGRLDIKGLFPNELSAALSPLNIPAFRGKQIFSWIHHKMAADFSGMTDLPVQLRERLAESFSLAALVTNKIVNAPDGTLKYLFELADGQMVETVYIPEPKRGTVCISTMVGCPFGCTFCATGQGGFIRNLTAGEIIDQVYRVQASLLEGQHVTNVVYMGMGEPLANFEQVLRSIRLLNHPQGLNISQRRITVSTVGITPGIERLAEEGLQINLAISLHAPTQEGRLHLLPIAKKYPLDSLMAAARVYVHRTGRKITFEYTVVPGSNDTEVDAAALAGLVRRLQCMVNVIPLNQTEGMPASKKWSKAELLSSAQKFVEMLTGHGVEAALRRSRGGEITGACGQLRRHG